MDFVGDHRLLGLRQMGRWHRAAALTREGGSWDCCGCGAVWEQWSDDGRGAFGWR
jgi:hypothetical protein